MQNRETIKTFLVTGGSGFFGGIMKRHILEQGHRCINVDLVKDSDEHPNLVKHQMDIRDAEKLQSVFAAAPATGPIDGVVHCAAILAHAVNDRKFLWTSNVDGTRNVMDAMRLHGVTQMVFLSSNCLWGESLGRPVREDDPPYPVEVYGQSKVAAERVIREYADIKSVIIRCPTIIDFGRLGLLAILFEFIHDGRRVWTVGNGSNRYQFIYAGDLANACMLALEYPASETFNIGSDNVKSLAEVYGYVVQRAQSNSVVAALPLSPTLAAMKLFHHLKISPLGPYHYKMIAEDFMFDTTRIKEKLGWQPTLTNEQVLWRAYQYYSENRLEIEKRRDVSAHRQGAKMGVIRLLKWIS
jgi:nucleoside-diphosphate-sugar epimerase